MREWERLAEVGRARQDDSVKILLAILSALSLFLGGLVFLFALAQEGLDLDARTSQTCTTFVTDKTNGTTSESCTGGVDGGAQTTVAAIGGSLVITGGLLAVASVGIQRRPHVAAPNPPAWSGHVR